MQTDMAAAYSTNTISEESFDFGGLGIDRFAFLTVCMRGQPRWGKKSSDH